MTTFHFRSRFRLRPRAAVAFALTLTAAFALAWLASAARAVEPVPTSRHHAPGAAPQPVRKVAEPGAPAGAMPELDERTKALRAEFHGKLDPLQAQVKAPKDQYVPQLKSLEEQRHDLVESGKPPEIQDLDRQEAAELAALADKEEAEHERVRQQYADARKDVQAKQESLREQAGGHGK